MPPSRPGPGPRSRRSWRGQRACPLPAGTLRCTHCKKLFIPTPGGTTCPSCKGVLTGEHLAQAERAQKRAVAAELRAAYVVENSKGDPCIFCGGPRERGQICSRCQQSRWRKASTSTVPATTSLSSREPTPTVVKRASDYRPAGSVVCYSCDGYGRNEDRSCTVCLGRGFLVRASQLYPMNERSSGTEDADYSPLANRGVVSGSTHKATDFPPQDRKPVGGSIFNSPAKRARIEEEPWYKSTPPPPRVCISCHGQKPKLAKCPRCKGSGVDPWALDEDDETEARRLFEAGWRPKDGPGGGIFQLTGKKKSSTTRLDVWAILHQLCVEKRLTQHSADKKSPAKRQ